MLESGEPVMHYDARSTVTPPIRVMCVDDHPLVREAIAQKVALQPDMAVVATAANGEEAIELFDRYRPDVSLMDLQLPLMSGLDAIRIIRRRDQTARIVVLTMYEGDEDIARAFEAGVKAYLLKNTLSDSLVQVVRTVYAGGQSITQDIAMRLLQRSAQPVLTAREISVVELIATGMRNKEIGVQLGIASDTVEAHIRNIFDKLRVHDRTAAVTVSIRRGIIHLK